MKRNQGQALALSIIEVFQELPFSKTGKHSIEPTEDGLSWELGVQEHGQEKVPRAIKGGQLGHSTMNQSHRTTTVFLDEHAWPFKLHPSPLEIK